MNLFRVLAFLAVILTVIVLVLAVAAVAAHALAGARERRIAAQRARAQDVVRSYLAGELGPDEALTQLRGLGEAVEGVLLQAASQAEVPARDALQHLLLDFGSVERELRGLEDRAWPVRLQAAARLGFMGSREAVDPLLLALDDEMLDVRLAAAHALARLQAPEAAVPILRHLSLAAQWPMQRVAEILAEMGPVAVGPLLDYLDAPGVPDAETAAGLRALGLLRANSALALLLAGLRNPNAEIRIQSAKALGELGPRAGREALEPLLHVVGDEVWEVRAAAAQALGRVDQPGAVQALLHGLTDAVWWVRFNAAEALLRLGDAGRQALRGALSHSDTFAREISRQVLEEQGLLDAAEQGAGT